MSRARLGRASVTLNETWVLPARRTYVTFGLERGGTSAVAGVQRALGVDLGVIEGNNNEDYAFHETPLDDMCTVIERRNAEADVWGFKYPNAGEFLPALQPHLRRPYYIVIHRDPVSTVRSRAKWDGEETSRPAMMALHDAGARGFANMNFALASDRPTLLVSNELAESRTGDLVDELAMFLGVPKPRGELRERILAYMERGSYKSFADYFPDA